MGNENSMDVRGIEKAPLFTIYGDNIASPSIDLSSLPSAGSPSINRSSFPTTASSRCDPSSQLITVSPSINPSSLPFTVSLIVTMWLIILLLSVQFVQHASAALIALDLFCINVLHAADNSDTCKEDSSSSRTMHRSATTRLLLRRNSNSSCSQYNYCHWPEKVSLFSTMVDKVSSTSFSSLIDPLMLLLQHTFIAATAPASVDYPRYSVLLLLQHLLQCPPMLFLLHCLLSQPRSRLQLSLQFIQ